MINKIFEFSGAAEVVIVKHNTVDFEAYFELTELITSKHSQKRCKNTKEAMRALVKQISESINDLEILKKEIINFNK